MKNQPHFCNGRFYNHEKDSIKSRLAHSAKVFFKFLPKLIFKRGKNKTVSAEIEKWRSVVSEPVQMDSTSSRLRQGYDGQAPRTGSLGSVRPERVEGLHERFTVTWIGHSTFLIKLFGVNIITDPVFSHVSRFFPRHAAAGLSFEQLPKIDFVLISHNHRDHLDLPSLQMLESRDNPTILVPFGDEKLLKKEGFGCVIQKRWWESQVFAQSKIIFTFLPAVHWSGRGVFDFNKSMWGSWLIQINDKQIYFAGDSAAGEHFELIGSNFSNIDLALLPIGPCEPRDMMCESHLDPQEAIEAFLSLDAKHIIPMHWGTFKSGFENVLFPIENLQKLWAAEELESEGRFLSILKFGQTHIFDEKC
jgi:L-ascorbate metabolism protein UlaG (beta-lactamase superfamily)